MPTEVTIRFIPLHFNLEGEGYKKRNILTNSGCSGRNGMNLTISLSWPWNEIKKANSNLVVIGKTALDNDKEDFDPDADDDDVDNVEESEGDEFEQEAR
ncbi:hypothetical protein CKAN_00454700 [Cinnamomum micranthum f. kanehirae]|uniref:Uncharacterized protein n=1 Tax=Cinnamomum micranthum f. kanehirae TaxID=337451 RepID=A0A3S3MAF2_9MAGN|nr:hypothetical protein CKAN_00454700 [Cinnamomum micranthum f. kanehirae]